MKGTTIYRYPCVIPVGSYVAKKLAAAYVDLPIGCSNLRLKSAADYIDLPFVC